MKTLAIVIAAYDVAPFVPDLLRSIDRQRPRQGWKYDFRIGVDGCEKTYHYLKQAWQPFLWHHENHGHGVMRNSLIYHGNADAYLYFDADDVMFPTLCAEICAELEHHNLVMPAKINTDIRLKPRTRRPVIENGGCMAFTHRVIVSVGGFQHYRCAIDTDFMRRSEAAGYRIHRIEHALYYRRSHPKALTKAPATRIKSEYRTRVWAEMTAMRQAGAVKIKPVYYKLKEVL